MKTIYRNTNRNAGAALTAVWAVDKFTTATKTQAHEIRVLLATKRLSRVKKKRSCRTPGEIATRVRHGQKDFRLIVTGCHGVMSGSRR
jgi:hypothetical protein